jgi:hypothetical protein
LGWSRGAGGGAAASAASSAEGLRAPGLQAKLDELESRKAAPELVKELIAEFHREVNRLSREREVDLGLQRRWPRSGRAACG